MEHKVLVVDDEKPICEALEKAFSKAGYRVFCAEDAEQGWEVIEKENIHVMFLDLNLPGISGAELCRKVRRSRPMDIIYAVTGYTSLFELADCREAGFDDYFTKPVELKALWKAAADAFEKLHRWR
ncbi:MAG: response regulator [Deltaproteobacteria bacterium]|nr:response regulator [Deltaproteobacteria bacterium]